MRCGNNRNHDCPWYHDMRAIVGRMSSYTTISGRATAEIEEKKKSRFIASVAHVETEEEALAFLEEIRAANRMARHNVYAYVLREGGAAPGAFATRTTESRRRPQGFPPSR